MDESAAREFLKHEYNRDGDSYRSPWTNTYFPACQATFFPSAPLLALEQKANGVFAQYVKLYYDYAVFSVNFVDTTTEGFNACFLVKKELKDTKEVNYGCWDAVHIVNCNLKGAPRADYRVISTVMITMEAETGKLGKMSIAKSCARTSDHSVQLPPDFGTKVDADMFHIKIIGKMIENNESLLRNEVADNYINKQRQITKSGRLLEEYMTKDEQAKF